MKKISKNLKKLYWLLACSPVFLFGAGGQNVLKTLEQNVNQQITDAGGSFASVLNTIVLVIGILWIIVLMLGALFNVEAIKNHIKFVIIASIVLGVTYGLTAAAM
ncbi:hypothetical protein YZ82_01885 [Campylobacter hyointestinalis]|uniref:Uncharacterized protein n=1 Tax=Campylobacter hyointestinalis TaxID=198 RepID=A0A562XHW7_CAMHY|nr:hypothetical protein [Campylobacter hyointestinalis]TWO21762.1 hypothetical protein YZ82_01885 [Campylobacter hyointestinalis]